MAHVPGTLNIPSTAASRLAGWLVPYTADFYLIVDDRAPQASATPFAIWAMIGLDRIAGYFDAAVVDQWSAAGLRPGTVPNHRTRFERIARMARSDAHRCAIQTVG